MYSASTVILAFACYAAVAQEPPVAPTKFGERAGSYRLSIGSNKTAYGPGETILVTSVIKNVADGPALFFRRTPFEFYDVDVRVPIPAWIPVVVRAALTPPGQRWKMPPDGSARGGYIPPGREVTDKFELNKLFEMSPPGDYRIIFSCKLAAQNPGDPRVTVTSNEIKVTVLEK